MKETLKKVFDKSVLIVVLVLFLFVGLFEYVVFPGLSASDSYINVLSLIIGLLSVMFIYHFIQWKDLFNFVKGKDSEDVVVPPGETELDYIPQEEINKKKTVKKTVKKKSVKKPETDKPKTSVSKEKPKSKPKTK